MTSRADAIALLDELAALPVAETPSIDHLIAAVPRYIAATGLIVTARPKNGAKLP